MSFEEKWSRMTVVERIAYIRADWAKCRETDDPMVLRIASAVAHDVCRQAADEIERLRAGGCARDQRTTQYCAEAARLQAERDEARLAYCREVLILYGDADEQYRLDPSEVARCKGWHNLLEILTGSPNRSEVAE